MPQSFLRLVVFAAALSLASPASAQDAADSIAVWVAGIESIRVDLEQRYFCVSPALKAAHYTWATTPERLMPGVPTGQAASIVSLLRAEMGRFVLPYCTQRPESGYESPLVDLLIQEEAKDSDQPST